MLYEWPLRSIGDLVDIKHGFAFKGEFFRDQPPGDILLTPGNFAIGGGYKEDSLKYYDGPVDDAYVLAPNELLVTMTDLSKNADTLGFPALVPSSPSVSRFLHNQRLGRVISLSNDQVDLRYLFYVMCTASYRHDVVAGATGSTVKHTSPSRIKSVKIPVPPLEIQFAIAHILGTLDDTIELNRQMNQTLEQIAAALFRSWFVDFDPVRAKAEGRQPEGMDAATAALFPDRFVDSEMGEIPEGWDVVPVGDVVSVVGGSTPPTGQPEYWGGEIPFATPKDLSKIDAPILLGTERHITEAGLARISSGRIPSHSLLLSSRAPIGYLAINDVPVAVNQGMIAMICKQGVSPWFMLGWAQVNQEEFVGRANGTTFLEISKRNFRPIPVIHPSDSILAAYGAIAEPLFARLIANVRQNQTLAQIRDTLLSRLLSGELRVPIDVLDEEAVSMPTPPEPVLAQSRF